MSACHAGRQLLLDLLHLDAHAFDDVQRVGVRQHPDAHEDSFLAGEPHFGVVVFRAEHDVGDVAQPHRRVPVLLADDQVLELIDRVQVGVGGQVDLKQRAFGAADGGEEVVLRQRLRAPATGLMLSAAIRSGFSQMRMAKVRPPRMSAFCTPSRAVRRGWTTRTR